MLWSAQFKLGYAHWFQAAARIAFTRIAGGALAVLLFAAIILAYLPARERRARASAAFCMTATGFTLMALQIFLLLGFSPFYGYVYHQLAIRSPCLWRASLLEVGWACAASAAAGFSGATESLSPFRALATIQFLLALSGPALIFLIRLLSRISSGTATLLAAQLVFPALAVLGGMLGGYQFPVATEIYLATATAKPVGRSLCPRPVRRLRRRSAVEHLSHSRLRLLENGVAQCGGKPGPALLAARVALEARAARA